MKRGIAISLYNKFDELAILHDILKNNFKDKYYLYVCSNAENADIEIKKRELEFDGFICGEDIFYSPKLTQEEQRLSLVCRSTDTVKKSCQLAIDNGCDYVMHIHCDAWPLNEDRLKEHFKLLEDNQNYSIAVRGLGWSYYGNDRPLGGIDDHFFLFNAKQMKDNNIFDFDVLEMLPHMLSVHGILGAQIIIKHGLSRCLYFDDFTGSICWEGEKKILPFLPVKPSLYDPKRYFLHVHRESFPDQMGHKLQSYYLNKNNLFKGNHIQEQYKNYPVNNQLPKILSERLSKGLRKLTLFGFNKNIYAQEILRIEKEVNKVTFKVFFKNYLKISLYWIYKKIKKKNNEIWPITLENYYTKKIQANFFFERNKFWFKDRK